MGHPTERIRERRSNPPSLKVEGYGRDTSLFGENESVAQETSPEEAEYEEISFEDDPALALKAFGENVEYVNGDLEDTILEKIPLGSILSDEFLGARGKFDAAVSALDDEIFGLHNYIGEAGGVTAEQIEHLNVLYERLLSNRDRVLELLEIEQPQSPVDDESESVVDTPTVDEFTAKDEAGVWAANDNRPHENSPMVGDGTSVASETEPPVALAVTAKPELSEQDSRKILPDETEMLVTVEVSELANEGGAVLQRVLLLEQRLAVLNQSLPEVDTTVTELKRIRQRLEDALDGVDAVPYEDDAHIRTVKLRQYHRVIDEAIGNIEVIERFLQQFGAVADQSLPKTETITENQLEDFDTASLISSIESHPTATAEEKTTAQALLDNYQRLQTSGASQERLRVMYESFRDYVSGILEDRKNETYTMFGMRLPSAGEGGVFGARSFREALRQQLHDAAVMGHPERTSALKAMIALLEPVPTVGLSELQVRELSLLVEQYKKIDDVSIPESISTQERVFPDTIVNVPHPNKDNASLSLELSGMKLHFPESLTLSEPQIEDLKKRLLQYANEELRVKPSLTAPEISKLVNDRLQFGTIEYDTTGIAFVLGDITLILQPEIPVTPDKPSSSDKVETKVDEFDRTTVDNSRKPPAFDATDTFDFIQDTLPSEEDERFSIFDDSFATVAARSDVPKTESVQRSLFQEPPRPDPDSDGNYLYTPEYKQFIKQLYGDFATFGRMMRQQAAVAESYCYDSVEKHNATYNSMYDFLRKKSVAEILSLDNLMYDDLRPILDEEGLKFDAFRGIYGWMGQLQWMLEQLPYTDSTEFGDLWGRYVAELEFQRQKSS